MRCKRIEFCLFTPSIQTNEDEYLQNQNESPAFREFLDLLAERVELKDFSNYRGGLDVKHGQTGEYSYYTSFQERSVFYAYFQQRMCY